MKFESILFEGYINFADNTSKRKANGKKIIFISYYCIFVFLSLIKYMNE